mgnify:CR=1 FL=1
MKIAQMVIASFLSVKVEEVDQLSTTQRDIGGFGSTGIWKKNYIKDRPGMNTF